jgi:hypothetical protein
MEVGNWKLKIHLLLSSAFRSDPIVPDTSFQPFVTDETEGDDQPQRFSGSHIRGLEMKT